MKMGIEDKRAMLLAHLPCSWRVYLRQTAQGTLTNVAISAECRAAKCLTILPKA